MIRLLAGIRRESPAYLRSVSAAAVLPKRLEVNGNTALSRWQSEHCKTLSKSDKYKYKYISITYYHTRAYHTRATKRIKRDSGELPTSFDLLALYKSDFGDRILSYASGADLCTLDALNKQFHSLTTDQWKVVTKDRFGMDNGKEGWKIGTSFLRPPSFVHNAGGYEGADGGSPHVAANENIIAYTSDFKINANESIELRDASTLNTISYKSSPISNWKVSICGRVGSEIIVTSNGKKICAQRRDNEVSYNVQQLEFGTNTGCGIETIGCETHLIVAHDGRVQLYEVNNEHNTRKRGREIITTTQSYYSH